MLNDNAQVWVAALRSGTYEQGHSQLTNLGPDGQVQFCCLGVACDLYAQRNPAARWEGDEFIIDDSGLPADELWGETEFLPTAVQDWLGLGTNSGGYAGVSSLAHQNDSGATFAEIADLIESEPEGLFAP